MSASDPDEVYDGSQDKGCDPPETYDDYGDWKDDYADAVGISRWREL